MMKNYHLADLNLDLSSGHFPVMLPEVLTSLQPHDGGRYLDCTFGGGGYSRALLKAAHCEVHAIDRDPDAIKRGQALRSESNNRLHLHHGNFGDMKALIGEIGLFDGIVLDLGVSSFQLDEAERGFSFRFESALDMRMSRTGRTAADIINHETEENIANILYLYGEEKRSRRIARAIIEARKIAPFQTTTELAELIRKNIPRERPGFDPSTRSFQALRIAVNDELGALERALEDAPFLLAPEGTLSIVTFHSLEDRMVKQRMAHHAGRVSGPSRYAPIALQKTETSEFSLPHTRPISPSDEELKLNIRSRSARLRSLRRHKICKTGNSPQ